MTVKYGVPIDFKALREEAKTCTKPRLKAIYQEIADQLMAAIAKLEPVEDDVRTARRATTAAFPTRSFPALIDTSTVPDTGGSVRTRRSHQGLFEPARSERKP